MFISIIKEILLDVRMKSLAANLLFSDSVTLTRLLNILAVISW